MRTSTFLCLALALLLLSDASYAQNRRERANKKARKETTLTGAAQTQTRKPAVSKQQLKAEREALIALYNATDGDNWTDNTNWLSDKPLEEWARVNRGESGMLTVYLSENGLKGTLPPALFQVQTIEAMDFSKNELTGNLPAEVGECTGLQYLSVGGNRLSGSLPDTWQGLKELVFLNLSGNNFEGTLPASLCELEKLGMLDLKQNRFSGSLPEK